MNASRTHDYKTQERGDRVQPGWAHRRYWVLIRLAEQMEAAAQMLPAGGSLLDYGAGNKPYEGFFKRRVDRYLAADLPGNPDADVDILPDGRLPLEDASVDVVLSTQVLEHVQDPQLYLKEAHRVLKPGGHLVLSTHGMWIYHADPNDYWRWTRQGLSMEVQRPGFDIVHLGAVLNLAQVAVQLWQDAIINHIPTFTRRLTAFAHQRLIRALESSRREGLDSTRDAGVFVVVAQKTR